MKVDIKTRDFLHKLVTDYLVSLEGNLGYRSENTVRAAKSDLGRFLDYASTKENALAQKILTENFVLDYIAQLKKSGLSDRSLSRHLSTLRKWFAWLENYATNLKIDSNLQSIRGPRLPNLLPKALSVDEIDLFFSQRKKYSRSWIDFRDIAVFELAYSSGVRVSELVNIDLPSCKNSLGSLCLKNMEVEVLGKGSKWRRLPIGEKARNAIEEWLKYREHVLPTNKNFVSHNIPLFLNRFGKRLSVRGIQRRFSICSIQSNSRISITPHMLRHSFASHILQSSKNLRAVQELLGHVNITSTQIYTKLDYQFLSEVYDKSHPRAKKNNS